MNDNYNRNKLLFNTLLNNNYKIKKITNNLLNIIVDNTKIQCKYILLFTIINKNILWADENPFNDKLTKDKIKLIKSKLDEHKIKNNEIYKIINFLLKYDNNQWILTNKKNNILEYYIITEIIYY